ncbi:hypothetical protein CTI12_AA407650 [Artemisia annua]|uniref:Uncharacterized protein n=1 Tax=Artemisia annua TaxID=35608 RepID=A0A2U1M876_ARTAN|nr:hypothetical protein CTI12_AA407650 [Artemisia annua]
MSVYSGLESECERHLDWDRGGSIVFMAQIKKYQLDHSKEFRNTYCCPITHIKKSVVHAMHKPLADIEQLVPDLTQTTHVVNADDI